MFKKLVLLLFLSVGAAYSKDVEFLWDIPSDAVNHYTFYWSPVSFGYVTNIFGQNASKVTNVTWGWYTKYINTVITDTNDCTVSNLLPNVAYSFLVSYTDTNGVESAPSQPVTYIFPPYYIAFPLHLKTKKSGASN